MEVIVIKKLFTLFVFLSFCGSTGFGADQCYKNKYSYKDSLVQQYVNDYRALLPLYTEAINEKNTEKIYNFTDSAQKLSERGLIISEILADSDEAQKFSEEMSEIAEYFFNTAIDISNR